MTVLRFLFPALILIASQATAATYHEYRFKGRLTDVRFNHAEYYDENEDDYVYLGDYEPVGKFSTFFGNSDVLGGTYIGQKLLGFVSFWFDDDGVRDIACKVNTRSCRPRGDNFEVEFEDGRFAYSQSDGESYVFGFYFGREFGKLSGEAYLSTDWSWTAEDERISFWHEGTDAYVDLFKVHKVHPMPLPLSAPLLLGAAFCFPLLRISRQRKPGAAPSA